MYIGELARLSGCTAKAIRLYEQMGLLSPQRRGSYRLYTAHHLTHVQMIRTAQTVGFKLGEMSELLAAKQHQAPFPLALADQGVEVKRLELPAQILALQPPWSSHRPRAGPRRVPVAPGRAVPGPGCCPDAHCHR